MSKLYNSIGIMTGTSADAVDFGYLRSDGKNHYEILQEAACPFPNDLRQEILQLASGDLKNIFITEKKYTEFVANATNQFITDKKISKQEVDFFGFHGQTIHHAPGLGLTKQIGNASLLTKITGIDVYADFRSADMANGGQGAPLAPIFHQLIAPTRPCIFLNIGGVANITYIQDSNDNLIAFDTGPGNALMDDYCQKFLDIPFDMDGILAHRGSPVESLLNTWLDDPYFKQQAPKSLDRNHFHYVLDSLHDIHPLDALSTLLNFTAATITDSINSLTDQQINVYIAGGGTKNGTLLKALGKNSNHNIIKADDIGIKSDFIEAYAFAYLAIRSHLNLPNTFPSTTNCEKATVGGIFCKTS